MSRSIGVVLVLGLAAAACGGGDSEYAYLYEAPQGEATGSLYGRWGGQVGGSDTRWVFAPDEITLANKCGNKIVGITVAASVDESEIAFLESAEDGNDSCFVRSQPLALPACDDDPFTTDVDCFLHDDTALAVFDDFGDSFTLIKLVDE
jgi:hypothetical protein